ncbi:cyclase family protein [Nocardia sp. NPDC003482]
MTISPAAEPDDDMTLLRAYIDECSNWGRWGPDDQIGALNLIGPAEIRRAAAEVVRGESISLTLPYDEFGPQTGSFRANPRLFTTATGVDHVAGKQDPLPGGFGPARGFGFADDVLVMPTQCGTQWDALSHIFWEGRMWNGRPASDVSSAGSATNGIENMTGRIVTRGILVDMPAHLGVAALEPGHAIEPDDLDAALAAHDIEIAPGDALLVRTGFMAARRGEWGDYAGGPAPGLSLHTAPWLHRHGVCAVATDTWGVEVRPNEIRVFQPLHVVSLVHGGLAFGEMFDLDALADHCAADGRYRFLFVASPLPLTGATGAPVSALALK